MKIAFIGIRGIPVVYCAFETFAESLAQALIKKKYQITVYCRSPYVDKRLSRYKGIVLHVLPTIKSKNFETIIHNLLSTIHACFFGKYNLIYFFGVGSAPFILLPKLLGIKTVINVDGLDWKREKWGFLAKKYLKYSEFLATKLADVVISDSLYIKRYYRETYNKETVYIAYSFPGYKTKVKKELSLLNKYNVKKEKYFIWVGRIIPDNHLEDLILAFKELPSDYKCLILGDDAYKTSYKEHISNTAKEDKRIILTGYINRDEVYALERNSFAYIETKRSGSTHQSLVEALALQCFIISNNYHVNKQILKDSVLYYKQEKKGKGLLAALRFALSLSRAKRYNYKMLADNVYATFFAERKIVNDYIDLFEDLNIR